jgi:hypothetical protein
MPIDDPMADLLRPQDKGGVGLEETKSLFVEPKIKICLTTDREKIDIDEIITKFCVLLGFSGCGKSNGVAVILEQLLDNKVPLLLVDLMGEHTGILSYYRQQFMEIDVSRKHEDQQVKELAKEFITSKKSCYLDLSMVKRSDYMHFLNVFLWSCIDLKFEVESEQRIPHMFVFEEAHNFIPREMRSYDQKNIDAKMVMEAILKMALEARKFGIRPLLISLRPVLLDTDTVAQAPVMFLMKVQHARDKQFYKDTVSGIKRAALYQRLQEMVVGNFIFFREKSISFHKRFLVRKTVDMSKTPNMASLRGFQMGQGIVDTNGKI